MWDIKLPAKSQAGNSVTGVLGEMLFALGGVGLGGKAEGGLGGKAGPDEEGGQNADPGSSLLSSSTSLLRTGLYQHLASASNSQEDDKLTKELSLSSTVHNSFQKRSHDPSTSSDAEDPSTLSPMVGQLTLRKVLLALKLDEERLAELLRGLTSQGTSVEQGGVVGKLLGCFGDLFSAQLDIGWPDRNQTNAEAERGSFPPKCMLTVKNNDVSRVRAEVESLMFQVRVDLSHHGLNQSLTLDP